MPAIRSLPPRPSIEFEKKGAKAFLRLLHAGDAEALARARAQDSAFATATPESFQLAHAQLIQAREYGFASWPKMVHYFDELERVRLGRRWERSGQPAINTSQARQLLTLHRNRHHWAARVFAAYVPRFYGLEPDEVFASPPTEGEAQLAYARSLGAVDWEALNSQWIITGDRRNDTSGDAVLLMDALDARDLARAKQLVVEYPQFVRVGPSISANGPSLPRMVLYRERRWGREAMAPFVDWLVAEGVDIQRELNEMLAGRMHVPVDEIHWLLDRGADPTWVAPNGIPILEHALLTHWNPVTVDMIASRATPRRALWVAAGLGDVDGVRRSLNSSGMPLPEAVRLRPPFDAVGARSLAPHPEPGDEELLVEAAFVAMINGRATVIEHLASRGFPVDSRIYGSTLLSVAVGNGLAEVTEALIKAGADLDIPTGDSNGTPREMGRSFFLPNDPARRRVAELCGWDPDTFPPPEDSPDGRDPGRGH